VRRRNSIAKIGVVFRKQPGISFALFILNDVLERDRGCVMTRGDAGEEIVAKLREVQGLRRGGELISSSG
jgi:hypothetical protein